jgi:hypothetical protein
MLKNLRLIFLSLSIAWCIVTSAKSQSKTETTILSNTRQHFFSDSKKKDTFTIALKGQSILSGNIILKIRDYKNKVIYEQKFKAEDLLGDMGEVLNNSEQQDTIKARMLKFFNEANYTCPAIAANDKFEYDSSTKDVWNDIKSDRAAIGFLFSYGYEDTYGIAYSKKKHKVVTYFYSD